MPVDSLFGEYRFSVLVALVLGLALRVFFVIATPFDAPAQAYSLSAYNDEPAHVGYTWHLLNAKKLPRIASPDRANDYGELPTFENYQSPLYYIVHALTCKLFKVTEVNSIARVGRWLSIVFMAALIAIALQIVSKVGNVLGTRTKALFIIFLSLSGVFVRFSTQSGNEMLAWLAIGWISLAFFEHERNHSARNLAWLVISFAMGLHVKLSVLITAPLILLALYRSYRLSTSRAVIGLSYLLLFTTPLALYNYSTFGSVVPLAQGFGIPTWRIPNVETLSYAARSAVFPWSEFWQGWKGMTLFLPALLVMGWTALSSLSRPKTWTFPFLLSLTSLIAFLWLNCRYDQAEARYLFVAWPALLFGFETLLPKFSSPWLLLIILSLPYFLFVF